MKGVEDQTKRRAVGMEDVKRPPAQPAALDDNTVTLFLYVKYFVSSVFTDSPVHLNVAIHLYVQIPILLMTKTTRPSPARRPPY